MNAICEDLQPQLLCLQTILVRHGEGPCHRLSPQEKTLCPKTCQTCQGPGCQDQVDRCDLEFISPYYNCDLLEASERLNCKRTCRLCPDQIATVSADYSDNPMGWGAAQYDYESTTRLFDTSTTRFEATGFTTEFTATTTEPSILTDQTTSTAKKIAPTKMAKETPSLVPSENGVPIMPVQPGILWPSSIDSPFLMPLWLPLWVVILVGIGAVLLTSICCCACFRFRIWQMRVTHYNEVKKLQKRVKKAEKENDKDKDVEKEVKKSETLPPQSPPQYSERMSDISSIRTATTMRSDRETLKSGKRSRKPDLKDISEEIMEEAGPLKSKDVSPRASSTNITVKEEVENSEKSYLEIETGEDKKKSTEASMTKEKPSSRHRENSTNTENEKTPIARKPESKKYKAAPPPRPNEPPPVPGAQRRTFTTTKTTATQSEEDPPSMETFNFPSPKVESVDLNLKRPQNRANEDELAQLETEVRKKIGKIYEKITGFVQQGALTPNTVRQSFPNYEVVQSNNTQEVLSRQVTPEAGAFDFTCDNSFSQQGRESRTMSYYSIKDVIPETIPEETSLEAAKSNGDFRPPSYDQVQMISDANELQVKLLEQQKMEEELEKFSRPKQEPVVSEEFPKQISNDHKLNENMQLKLKMCDESRPKDVIDGEDVCSELSDTTLSSSSSSILTSYSEATYSKSTNISKATTRTQDASHTEFVKKLFV